MIASVFVWVAVAAILLIVLVARIVAENHRAAIHNHRHSSHHHRLKPLELGKEREEFFITGDSELIPGDDYDIYYNS